MCWAKKYFLVEYYLKKKSSKFPFIFCDKILLDGKLLTSLFVPIFNVLLAHIGFMSRFSTIPSFRAWFLEKWAEISQLKVGLSIVYTYTKAPIV